MANPKPKKITHNTPSVREEAEPRYIRITAAPPGEAPEAVRQAWVGIRLPVLDNDGQPRVVRTAGVLTGPKSFFAKLLAWLNGSTKRVEGFRVHSATAIALLDGHAPTAAAWWHTHSPQYCTGNRVFVFDASVAEIENELAMV